MESIQLMSRLIESLRHLALKAHRNEYQMLRVIETIYRRCLEKPLASKEDATYLAEMELKWLAEYQADQDRFVPWRLSTSDRTLPGCAEQMEALLVKNAAIALNGAIEIAAFHGVSYDGMDGDWWITRHAQETLMSVVTDDNDEAWDEDNGYGSDPESYLSDEEDERDTDDEPHTENAMQYRGQFYF